ncbi:LysE family transporter [Paenibacillus sp. FSL H8-0259]|uniref:LysE family transporter n=1 Tax=Paenibacillus sp. FSL H8-0259 TaxID=1920423 RepID=UPI00096F0BC3|nr:LysE family transporter [Paenibacillus sp. FSL H8-0259]OMF33676.1 threonine transporter [Paenibacillus sp. FSL H8-0259]
MNVFIGYIFLGLSLSAPLGPINAAQLDKGLRGGFMPAWAVGLGAVSADIIYMLLVYFGLIHLLDDPFVKVFLWLFGFFVLVYTGVDSIKNTGDISVAGLRGSDASLSRSYVSGFLMSLFNPLSILFWLGIYGSILAEAASNYPMQQLLIYSGAIVLGILLWDVTMAAASSLFRKFLTVRVLQVISVLSGLSLIGFGFYFGVQVARLLFFH